ncbi:unannotated protein [freshwater metagenome]|uniref:Unannotated protein n=1 Tax=freshwater metagenome TaxID=449393 RepID=A0A6J7QP72_9ZZZZ
MLDDQHRAITLGIVTFVTLVAFEGTAVITALPVVARDLNSVASLAWIINAFVAASLMGQVLAGEWGDRLGPRLPLLFGIAAFGLGGLVAGIATAFPVLIAGRALQGLGAGGMIVVAYVIIGRAYPTILRAKAFSLLSAAWVLPAIVGPVIAGWLADSVSWRWVFLVVVVLIWPPLFLVLPRLRQFDGAHSDEPRRTGRVRAGAQAAVGLVAVQDAAQRGTWVGVIEAAVGLALLVPALLVLLPAGTLRVRRGLPTVIAVRGLMAGAFFSAEAWIPLSLQTVRGVSTTWSGLFLACGAIGWASGAWFQGHAPVSFTPARLVRIGSTLVVVSLVTLPLCLVPGLPVAVLVPSWLIGSLGMGMSVSSLATLLLDYSAPGEQGANSAGLQVADSSGVVLITGLTGAFFAASVATAAPGGAVFSVMWMVSAFVAVLAALAAGRLRRPA